MTAKELIEILQRCPPDAVVMSEDEEGIAPLHFIGVQDAVKTTSVYNPAVTWYYYKGDRALRDITYTVEFQAVMML